MTGRVRSFGPIQLAHHLGWSEFQVTRGLRLGLVPAPDRGSRWSADLVEVFKARAEQVRSEVGSLPDLGATRTAAHLSERLGVEVTVDAVIELGRREVLPVVDWYKGHPLFDGLAVERLTDAALLTEAAESSRTMTADEATAHLQIRRSDFGHLIRSGLVTPVRWVRSSWARSRSSAYTVALFRVADLDSIAENSGIDWAAVRATVPGRRSLLAKLPTATTTRDDEEVQR